MQLNLVKRSRALVELLLAMLTGLVALIAATRITGVGWDDLGGLWGQGDLVFMYGLSRALDGSSWLTLNNELGYPFGQDWSHFPITWWLTLAILKFLLIGMGPVAAVNSLWLLSFALAAVAMYLALRCVRVQQVVAASLALAFSLLPWHFAELEHTSLSLYWVIPVGIIWLALILNLPMAFPSSARLRFGVGVFSALAMAWNDPYYLVFLTVLGIVGLAFAGNRLGARNQKVVSWTLGLLPIVVFGVTLLVIRGLAAIPAVSSAAARAITDQYQWGGLLSSIFVNYSDSPLVDLWPNAELREAVGLAPVGESALFNAAAVWSNVVVLILLLGLLFGTRRRIVRSEESQSISVWAGLWLTAILLMVMSGLGLTFSVIVHPQIRVWGRMSIVVAAISFVIVGILISQALRGLQTRGGYQRIAGVTAFVVLASVLLVDVLWIKFPIKSDNATLPRLSVMFADSQDSLNAGCPILNYPMTGFPEGSSIRGMINYDPLLPYIASVPNSNFTYGAMSTQVGAAWPLRLSGDPATLKEQVSEAGLCAVLVDSAGLEWDRDERSSFESAFGVPVASAANRWFLYAASPDQIQAREPVLFHAPEARPTSGFPRMEYDESYIQTYALESSTGEIIVTNPSSKFLSTFVEFELLVDGCGVADISIHPAPESLIRLTGDVGLKATIAVDVPSMGTTPITISTAECETDNGNETNLVLRSPTIGQVDYS